MAGGEHVRRRRRSSNAEGESISLGLGTHTLSRQLTPARYQETACSGGTSPQIQVLGGNRGEAKRVALDRSRGDTAAHCRQDQAGAPQAGRCDWACGHLAQNCKETGAAPEWEALRSQTAAGTARS